MKRIIHHAKQHWEKAIIAMLLVVLLFSFFIPESQSAPSEELVGRWAKIFEADGYDFDWYEVPENVIEACHLDGGTSGNFYNRIEQQSKEESPTQEENFLVQQMTLTLQAQKHKVIDKQEQKNNDGTEQVSKDEYIYEVSWFIQPFVNPATYTVTLKSSKGKPDILIKPAAQATTLHGDGDYWAQQITGVYDTAILEYNQGQGKNQVVRDIVDK